MNINPYSHVVPHYDSYEDFYKFFEVHPREVKTEVTPQVFPPAQLIKTEEHLESKVKQEKRKSVKIHRDLLSKTFKK